LDDDKLLALISASHFIRLFSYWHS